MSTRREKIVFGIIAVVAPVVMGIAFFFPGWLEGIGEFVYMLLVVVPIGWLLATDPERIKRGHDGDV